MPDTLPDSRLSNTDFGAQLIDWPLPDGRTVRIECLPCFCANCGTPGPFVPKENTTYAFWLCQPCFDAYGEIAGTLTVPDVDFWASVEAEMIEHFGHILTQHELAALAEQGWGKLASLAKDSPIRLANPHSAIQN